MTARGKSGTGNGGMPEVLLPRRPIRFRVPRPKRFGVSDGPHFHNLEFRS